MDMHPQPLSGNVMPRFAGPATMLRLPAADSSDGYDAAFVGVPLDVGTSNRPGARFGPRAIRAESGLLRPVNLATGIAPFDVARVTDVGDVPLNTFNLAASIELIEGFFDRVIASGCIPISLGGDHTITLPILRAIAQRHGPVGLVDVDAHADTGEHMFGERIAHGTVFRRAFEEGLLDGDRVVQIGLRGTGYGSGDWEWGRERGFRVVPAVDCWYQSLAPLMADVRAHLGAGPVYVTFDIDGLDPSVAPGTGTPEPAGLTASQGFEIIRGCLGLSIVGADVVEVSPPYDTTGNTALLGANIAYELLCATVGSR
jgi:guanidinobutyrase